MEIMKNAAVFEAKVLTRSAGSFELYVCVRAMTL